MTGKSTTTSLSLICAIERALCLHPEDHASLVAADHRKGEDAATKRDRRRGDPSVPAHRLSQERVAEEVEELGERIEVDDEMVLRRKKIGLPHHRRDEEPYHQPGGDELNGIAIAHASHGDDISRPRHRDPG